MSSYRRASHPARALVNQAISAPRDESGEKCGLILLLSADLDIQMAFNRYEDYQAGRGEIFMRQLDAAFSVMRRHPQLGSPYTATHRRMLMREFPYGIFYTTTPSRLIVVAVLDLRQDPQGIQRRISRH